MKLIRHPESESNNSFFDCYMVTSDDYKGTVLKIHNINLSETTNNLEFDVELKYLLLSGEIVTDPFIIASTFEEIKPKVGDILVDAIRNMVMQHSAQTLAENTQYGNQT